MTQDDIEVYQPQSSDLTIGRTAVDDWYDPFPKIIKLAEYVAATEFVPDAMRNRPAAVAAAILTGREMGLPPMVSLRHLFVVRGRVGQSAELMRAQIYRAGHELKVIESTDARCVLEGRRDGETEWTRVQFTVEDARKNSIDIRYYTADKLFARATTRLARRKFPDAVMGLPTVDELEDGASPAEVIELNQAPPIKRARVTRRPKAANTQPAPPAAEPTAAEPDAADAELADMLGEAVKPVTRPGKPAEPEPAPAPAEPAPAKKRRRGRPTKAEAEQIAQERAAIAAAREHAKAQAAARQQAEDSSPPRADQNPVYGVVPGKDATMTGQLSTESRALSEPATATPDTPIASAEVEAKANQALTELGWQPPGAQATFPDVPAPPLSPEQRTKLILTLREVGITSHEDRTIIVGEIIGRPIDTTNDLDRDEATRTIATITRWQTEGTADAEITNALNTWALRQVDRDE